MDHECPSVLVTIGTHLGILGLLKSLSNGWTSVTLLLDI